MVSVGDVAAREIEQRSLAGEPDESFGSVVRGGFLEDDESHSSPE